MTILGHLILILAFALTLRCNMHFTVAGNFSGVSTLPPIMSWIHLFSPNRSLIRRREKSQRHSSTSICESQLTHTILIARRILIDLISSLRC